ncbi:hypothetical protein C0989_003311, partial [Termitomyces sp. Mn162]
MGAEHSKGHQGNISTNQGDIGEAGPSTSKCTAVGIAKGLVTSPRVATTPKSKEKGKRKAREEEEEEEEFEELIQDSFTNKQLVRLLHWQKASTVVDTGMGIGVVLVKAKKKTTVLLEERKSFKKTQGV